MRRVFFLSDFGSDSLYTAAVRAVLARKAPDVVVEDVTHSVPPQNVRHAALLLEDFAPYLPSDALLLAVVDPGVGTSRRVIAVRTESLTAVAPDNGLLETFLSGAKAIHAVTSQEIFLKPVSATFHARDVMAPALAYLASGGEMESLGPAVSDPVRLELPRPVVKPGRVDGSVVAVDGFGNVATDIRAEHLFEAFETDDPLPLAGMAVLMVGDVQVYTFARCYAEAPKGVPFALVGSFGRVEISLREGSAAGVLPSTPGTPVTIRVPQATARFYREP